MDFDKNEPGMTLQREVKRDHWIDYMVDGKPVKSPVDLDTLPPGKYRLVEVSEIEIKSDK